MLLFAAFVSGANAEVPTSGLDVKGIHSTYTEGDFETVIASIDAFTRTHPTYSKDDSIFIAKHLAVVYTANPRTREIGKNYMFRLLELLPSAKIIDMFVSDEIDRIFERVREEYVIRLTDLGKPVPALDAPETKAEVPGPSTPGTGNPPAPATRGSAYRTLYWTAGGAALVGIGVFAYMANSGKQKQREVLYQIDPPK